MWKKWLAKETTFLSVPQYFLNQNFTEKARTAGYEYGSSVKHPFHSIFCYVSRYASHVGNLNKKIISIKNLMLNVTQQYDKRKFLLI